MTITKSQIDQTFGNLYENQLAESIGIYSWQQNKTYKQEIK